LEEFEWKIEKTEENRVENSESWKEGAREIENRELRLSKKEDAELRDGNKQLKTDIASKTRAETKCGIYAKNLEKTENTKTLLKFSSLRLLFLPSIIFTILSHTCK